MKKIFVFVSLSFDFGFRLSQAKMRAWIANGVEVAWLVDPQREVVEVYRQGREVEVIVDRVVGDGAVSGFVLELGKIWG